MKIESEIGPSFTQDTWKAVKRPSLKAKSSSLSLGSRKATRQQDPGDPLDLNPSPLGPVDNSIKTERYIIPPKQIIPSDTDDPTEILRKTVKELRIAEEDEQYPRFFHGKVK